MITNINRGMQENKNTAGKIFFLQKMAKRTGQLVLESEAKRSKANDDEVTEDATNEEPVTPMTPTFKCSICFEKSTHQALDCQHNICLSCARRYISIKIRDGHKKVSCPTCDREIREHELVRASQGDQVWLNNCRWILQANPRERQCPNGCNFSFIISANLDDAHLKVECVQCKTSLCQACGRKYHPGLRCFFAYQSSVGIDDTQLRLCPSCAIPCLVTSCSSQTCPRCGHNFCGACLNPCLPDHRCPMQESRERVRQYMDSMRKLSRVEYWKKMEEIVRGTGVPTELILEYLFRMSEGFRCEALAILIGFKPESKFAGFFQYLSRHVGSGKIDVKCDRNSDSAFESIFGKSESSTPNVGPLSFPRPGTQHLPIADPPVPMPVLRPSPFSTNPPPVLNLGSYVVSPGPTPFMNGPFTGKPAPPSISHPSPFMAKPMHPSVAPPGFPPSTAPVLKPFPFSIPSEPGRSAMTVHLINAAEVFNCLKQNLLSDMAELTRLEKLAEETKLKIKQRREALTKFAESMGYAGQDVTKLTL